MNNELYIATIALAKQHLEQAKEDKDTSLVARFIGEIQNLELQHYIFITATTNTEEATQ
jgi:hypothetical protein